MKKILALIAIFLNLSPLNAYAWAGYEESTNIAIDIPSGSLVRIGREINIYDFGTNSYHTVEINFMEDIFSGTRLEVIDLETNKKRIFYMERT